MFRSVKACASWLRFALGDVFPLAFQEFTPLGVDVRSLTLRSCSTRARFCTTLVLLGQVLVVRWAIGSQLFPSKRNFKFFLFCRLV